MADLYGTLDDLKKADHTELLKLRELVRQQQRDPNPDLSLADSAPVMAGPLAVSGPN